jgi:hypothetical protein
MIPLATRERKGVLVTSRVILCALWVVSASVLLADSPPPTPTSVRHPEGLVHGFLALRTLGGETLAAGDLIQHVKGDEVTSRLAFSFRDGSSHDETAVFTQGGTFQLRSYKLVQKGPAFERPTEVTLDRKDGRVIVRHKDDKGEEKVETETIEVPVDLANGMVPILLKNVRPDSPPTMSFLAATPKPRLVRLEATAAGEEPFRVAGDTRKATHYVVKVKIGGVTGFLASLLGKQPPDTHVWILGGEAPAFVKSEGPLYLGGPPWRIELTGPVWSASSSQ